MIWNYYKKFFNYFQDNKREFYKYSVFSFMVGVLELFGVALTYPFVLKLLNSREQENFWTSPLFLGILIVALFIVKNIFMIFYAYMQAKYTRAVDAEVNLKFMKYFLTSSYQKTSKISHAQKSNILNYLIPNTINNFILRLLNLNVNCFIFCLISLFLVLKFPVATLVTAVCACVLVYLQNKFYKPQIEKFANLSSEATRVYTQRSNEILLNTKSIKVAHSELEMFRNYEAAVNKMNNVNRKTLFFSTIPPYVTEPFIIILLFILLATITVMQFSNPEKLLAEFAVIVSAIFRLAPTVARIQVNINGINSVLPIVDELLTKANDYELKSLNEIPKNTYLDFEQKIELKNLNFGYEVDKPVLHNINLQIQKGEFLGIVGLSGCGKTTLADIIAGLLDVDSGEFVVDDVHYTSMPQLKIGYIPQELSIYNATIRENVASISDEIDDAKVIEALKKARLYDFVIDNFKEGIYANPFVDNIGFSQGQKQRIAIARALYSNPDILILDEATSSLDLKTEDEICTLLNELKGKMTIIAIAHRLSTIQTADKIAYIKNGTIKAVAPFKILAESEAGFAELINLASLK